jgi:hypothetical protein
MMSTERGGGVEGSGLGVEGDLAGPWRRAQRGEGSKSRWHVQLSTMVSAEGVRRQWAWSQRWWTQGRGGADGHRGSRHSGMLIVVTLKDIEGARARGRGEERRGGGGNRGGGHARQ